MTRGIGVLHALQDAVPPELVPVFVVITYFGSLWVVLPGVALLYRMWDSDRAALVGSAALGGFALTLTLKTVFALPRPPASLHLIRATGYGFPSGHALDATVTYGILACLIKRGTYWQRGLVASLVVGLIALSRVVLGVHYVVDVVAGIVLGVGYLAVVMGILGQSVIQNLIVAGILAVAGVLLTGGQRESVILLGAIVAALLVWIRREANDG